MHAKKRSISNITSTLAPLYEDMNKSLTTLFELSTLHYKRIKMNAIHVTGLSIKEDKNSKGQKKDITLYTKVEYGSNINRSTKKVNIGENNWYQYINLTKTEKRFCVITACKDECVQIFPNTHIFGTSLSDKRGAKSTRDISLSGIVVLMLSTLPSNENNDRTMNEWDNNTLKMIKSCKPDVLKTYDHHGSAGSCYAFGNKPSYGMVDDSSVGVYTNKNSKNDDKQDTINKKATDVERICSETITKGVNSLSIIIPDLKYLLSPILDTADKIQKKIGKVVLEEVPTTSCGCWNSFLYVNGRTEELHTEQDCAYTLIAVPPQKLNKDIPLSSRPVFLFQLGIKEQLMIPLVTNASIVYNGKFVTHRQAYNPIMNTGDNYFNLSSYGNQKIFNHLRQTFKRMTTKV